MVIRYSLCMHLVDMGPECRPCSLPEGSRCICSETGHMGPTCAWMDRRCQELKIERLQGGLSLEPPLQNAQIQKAVLQSSLLCILRTVENMFPFVNFGCLGLPFNYTAQSFIRK